MARFHAGQPGLAWPYSVALTGHWGFEAMKRLALAAALAVTATVTASAAFAGTHFYTYEGKDTVREGTGGAKEVVGGVDFWIEGSPPRRFQLIGVLTDDRLKTGLFGIIAMADLKRDMARHVRKVGGDAVVMTQTEDTVEGATGATFTSGQGTATAFGNSASFLGSSNSSSFVGLVKTHHVRYYVIKYLVEATPPAEAPAAPAPAPSPTQ
jgi:hypothetical protein